MRPFALFPFSCFCMPWFHWVNLINGSDSAASSESTTDFSCPVVSMQHQVQDFLKCSQLPVFSFWECMLQPAKWIGIAPISQIGQFIKQMTITELLFRSSYYSSLKPVYSIHLLTRCRSHAINEKALSTNSWHRSVSDLLLLLFIGSISYILILVDWSIVFRFLLQNGKIFQSLSLKLILLCARRRWVRYSAQMFFRKLPAVV